MKRLVTLTIAVAALAATPAAASPPDPHFDWYGLGGCTVPVIGMPTDFRNVEPYIPEDQQAKVITTGTGDQRQAGLIFVLIRCPENILETANTSLFRNDVVQVMVGVLYEAGTVEDANKAQFYLLSSALTWDRFGVAEKHIGIPSDFVENATLDVVRDPVTSLGTFDASVPSGRAPLAIEGQIVAPNPSRDWPQDAVHFYKGERGLVRVHHDESWAAGNEALGTVNAPAGSLVAGWMGATSRQATGVYVWINDVQHVHRYTIVG